MNRWHLWITNIDFFNKIVCHHRRSFLTIFTMHISWSISKLLTPFPHASISHKDLSIDMLHILRWISAALWSSTYKNWEWQHEPHIWRSIDSSSHVYSLTVATVLILVSWWGVCQLVSCFCYTKLVPRNLCGKWILFFLVHWRLISGQPSYSVLWNDFTTYFFYIYFLINFFLFFCKLYVFGDVNYFYLN